MDEHIPLTASAWPSVLLTGTGVAGAGLFLASGYPVCATLLLLATAVDVMLYWRRPLAGAAVALCRTGARWWIVDSDGTLAGPYWLDRGTRHGPWWATLCLRDAARQRQRFLLGPWSMDGEQWRRLKWSILEHSRDLEKWS